MKLPSFLKFSTETAVASYLFPIIARFIGELADGHCVAWIIVKLIVVGFVCYSLLSCQRFVEYAGNKKSKT